MQKKILVLTDNKVGSSKQALACARLITNDFKVVKVHYTKWANTPNFFPFSAFTIAKKDLNLILDLNPDIVIAAGRKLARLVKYLKNRNTNLKAIQILKPDLPASVFDILILPKHDKFKEKTSKTLLINIDGAITNPIERLSEEESEYWHEKFENIPSPRIALFIGGDAKHIKFMEHHARELANKTIALAKAFNGGILVSNSKRSGQRLSNIIFKLIKQSGVPHHIYDVNSDYVNPYNTYLNLADYIIATGDSISMCAECIEARKPLLIYRHGGINSKKHLRYIDYITSSKEAYLLDETVINRKLNPSKGSNEKLRQELKIAMHKILNLD